MGMGTERGVVFRRSRLFNRLDWIIHSGLGIGNWRLEIGDWLSGFGSYVTLHDLNGAPARDFVFSSLLCMPCCPSEGREQDMARRLGTRE
jgi:hypothetical protein